MTTQNSSRTAGQGIAHETSDNHTATHRTEIKKDSGLTVYPQTSVEADPMESFDWCI